MNDAFERRVRAAAVAGWWVVLVAAGLLLLSWIAYLVAIPAQPAWFLPLWGPNLEIIFDFARLPKVLSEASGLANSGQTQRVAGTRGPLGSVVRLSGVRPARFLKTWVRGPAFAARGRSFSFCEQPPTMATMPASTPQKITWFGCRCGFSSPSSALQAVTGSVRVPTVPPCGLRSEQREC
jgi:hypothetical protein